MSNDSILAYDAEDNPWRYNLPANVWYSLSSGLEFQMTPRKPSDDEIKAAKRRGKVTEMAYESSIYDDTAPPGNLLRFEKWIRKAIERIPTGRQRSSAMIGFEGGDEDTSATIKITYTRPETDEEWAVRKTDVARRLQAFQDYAEQQRRAVNEKIAVALGGVAL